MPLFRGIFYTIKKKGHNMNGYIYQQSNMMCPPPDKDEKKQLRRYYFRIAWIVVTLIFVFIDRNQR